MELGTGFPRLGRTALTPAPTTAREQGASVGMKTVGMTPVADPAGLEATADELIGTAAHEAIDADADLTALAAPGRVRVLALTVFAAALASTFGSLSSFGQPAWWALPSLAAAVALSELAVVHFSLGRQRWTLSCTDALHTLVFVLLPGSWMVLMVPAGVAVAQLVRRQQPAKTVFNVVQFAASTAAGVGATELALHGGLPRLTAAALGTTACWLVQTPLVAAVVAATSGRSPFRLLAESAPLAFVHTAASASVGLLAGWLAMTAPIGLLGLLVPVVLLWSSFDQTSRRAAEARLFAELARGQEQAGGGSVDVSAQVMLTAAARLLGGADIELIVFSGDGIVRYVGNEASVPVHERVPVDVLDQRWITDVLARGVVTGRDDDLRYCSLRVGRAESPLALLRARRPIGDGTFTRDDIRVARVLVGQAESWLSVADLAASRDAARRRADAADHTARALGEMGADALPALVALRQSSSRLAHLARHGSDAKAVDRIVDELHTVEGAVASLLGAIALAAEPDLQDRGDAPGSRPVHDPGYAPPEPARLVSAVQEPARWSVPAEWTSSGRLE